MKQDYLAIIMLQGRMGERKDLCVMIMKRSQRGVKDHLFVLKSTEILKRKQSLV